MTGEPRASRSTAVRSGGGVGAVQTEGTTATVLAVALLPLVPALLRAIRAIAAAPRERADGCTCVSVAPVSHVVGALLCEALWQT